jgi:hypothetical protein
LTNLGLVIFNMIPAFPMDGGRILRALLAGVIGHLPATEVAAGLSVVIAVLMGIFGVFQLIHDNLTLLPLVALFVFFAGQMELMAVRQRDAMRRAGAVGGLPVDPVLPGAGPPPEPNYSGFTWNRQHGVWIEWRDGRPVYACSVPFEGTGNAEGMDRDGGDMLRKQSF